MGCLLAVAGGFFPLVTTDIRRERSDGNAPTIRGVDHNWFTAPGIGNGVLGLAVAGAVLLAGGHPGVAAGVGAGLVAFVAPLPFQVQAGEFGYFGWATVALGGVLLTCGGGVEALRQAGSSHRVEGGSAEPVAAPDPAA